MKKGFTLVELLIVVAIMGILTTITVSQFQTAKRKANDVARKGDMDAVAKALQMYYADYGKMPEASEDGRIMAIAGSPANWGGEFIDNSGYVYMKILPKENNINLKSYCYKTDVNRSKYALFAMLENGVDSQCDRDGDGVADQTYDCGGNTDAYCFAYQSPNTRLDGNGNFQ